MQVNLNINAAAPLAKATAQTKVKTLSGTANALQFAGAASLDQTFGETPDIRPELVDRARKLVSQSSYPPAETIKKISVLLAFNINQDDLSL